MIKDIKKIIIAIIFISSLFIIGSLFYVKSINSNTIHADGTNSIESTGVIYVPYDEVSYYDSIDESAYTRTYALEDKYLYDSTINENVLYAKKQFQDYTNNYLSTIPVLSWNYMFENFIQTALETFIGLRTMPDSNSSLEIIYTVNGTNTSTYQAQLTVVPTDGSYGIFDESQGTILSLSEISTIEDAYCVLTNTNQTNEVNTVVKVCMYEETSAKWVYVEFDLGTTTFKPINDGEVLKLGATYWENTDENYQLLLESDYFDIYSLNLSFYQSKNSGEYTRSTTEEYITIDDTTTIRYRVDYVDENLQTTYSYYSNELEVAPLTFTLLIDGEENNKVFLNNSSMYNIIVDGYENVVFHEYSVAISETEEIDYNSGTLQYIDIDKLPFEYSYTGFSQGGTGTFYLVFDSQGECNEYLAFYTNTLTFAVESVIGYTITFIGDNDVTLQTGLFKENTLPVYSGEEPTKESDAQYTYTFIGWYPEVVNATEDATYTAEFESTVQEYTICWLDGDGVELYSETLAYGTTPTYTGTTPTKASDEEFIYTFIGWDPEITSVTEDTTYTAQFESIVREYIITWVDGDGEVISTDTVTYGRTPTYNGNIPTKTSNAEFSYSFIGWDPEITSVREDATYTAQFDSIKNKYIITWLDSDSATLMTDEVEYGIIPQYSGTTPIKASTSEFTYTFTGWDPEIVVVTEDATYTAQFSSTDILYTITWVMDDGETIDTTTLAYGVVPTHDDITKEATSEFIYRFIGWDPEIVSVTEDTSYTAQFESIVREYIITWVNGDGVELYSEELEYGIAPQFSGLTPTKTSTQQYTYIFNGTWYPEIVSVTEDTTYTAQFDAILNEYTIYWLDGDGVELYSETLAYGTTPVYRGSTPYKEETTYYVYEFSGWNPVVTPVMGDARYHATFTETLKSSNYQMYDNYVVVEGQTIYFVDEEYTRRYNLEGISLQNIVGMNKNIVQFDNPLLSLTPTLEWTYVYEYFIKDAVYKFIETYDVDQYASLIVDYRLNSEHAKEYYKTIQSNGTSNEFFLYNYNSSSDLSQISTIKDNINAQLILSEVKQANVVESYIQFTFTKDGKTINIIFDFGKINFRSIDDGELIRAEASYFYFSQEPNHDRAATEVVFSSEYLSDEELVYYVSLNDGAYYRLGSSYLSLDGDSLVRVKGKFIYNYQGVDYSFYSNELLIEPFEVTLLLDGKALEEIETSKEYEYSVLINNTNKFTYYDFFIGINDEVFQETYPVKYKIQNEGVVTVSIWMSGKLNEFVSFNTEVEFELKASKVEKVVEKVIANYEVVLDLPTGSYMVVGGDIVTIHAKSFKGDREVSLKHNLDVTGSSLTIVEQGSDYISVIASSAGSTLIYDVVEIPNGGTIQRSITIFVIQPTKDNVTLDYKDDFNKTGTTIVGTLSIDGESNFINYNPQFIATHTKDDVTNPVSLETNGCVVQIPDTLTGMYEIKVLSPNGDLLLTSSKKVAPINLDLLTKRILPFVTLLLIVLLVVFITFLTRINQTALVEKTLSKEINKINNLLEQSFDSKKLNKYLRSLHRSLSTLINLVDGYDHDTQGQYVNLLTSLREAQRVVESSLKSFNKIDEVTSNILLRYLVDKYLTPCFEISCDLTKELSQFKKHKTVSSVVTVDEKDIPKSELDEFEKMRYYYERSNLTHVESTEASMIDESSQNDSNDADVKG